jgi:GntR family uxuAB operon transcriptional repressor
MNLPDIRPTRRYMEVAQSLLTGILDSRYPLDTQLPTEREIAEAHNVSRSTAREAVLALEIVGIVQVRRGEGIFASRAVAPLSALAGSAAFGEHPTQLVEARKYIEPIIAGHLTRTATTEQLAELVEVIDAAQKLIHQQDQLANFSSLGLEFHTRLSAMCTNPILAAVATDLTNTARHPLWALINQIAVRDYDARVHQLEEHRRIVRALATRDEDVAAAAMRNHITHLITTVYQFPIPNESPSR